MQKNGTIITFNNIPDFLATDRTKEALVTYIDSCGYAIDRLVYNFVSKERLLQMNQQFLHHDTHTDIISFDYTQNKSLSAEFFISLWAVGRSAKEVSQSIENETLRVLVHGVLHCMGKKDSTVQQKAAMRKYEDEFINLFHVKHNKHV